jgi:hypothetical protein
MQGSGRVPQWFAGQVSRLDPRCVLSAPVNQLARSQHSAKGIGTVAAPDRGLSKIEQLRTLIHSHRVEVRQHLIQQRTSRRRNASPRPLIAAAFPLLPELLASHSGASAIHAEDSDRCRRGVPRQGIPHNWHFPGKGRNRRISSGRFGICAVTSRRHHRPHGLLPHPHRHHRNHHHPDHHRRCRCLPTRRHLH